MSKNKGQKSAAEKHATIKKDNSVAIKEAVEAILNARKSNIAALGMQRVGRGFMGRNKAEAIKVLIAIEDLLYEGGENRLNKSRRYGTKELKYKGESEEGESDSENAKNAKLIQGSDPNGVDVAIAVMEFLKTEKLQLEEPKEGKQALALEPAGVNTPALGRQMILRVKDIKQENVTRALKEIASNLDRFVKEKELRQEKERLSQEAAELKIINARKFEEELEKLRAYHYNKENGENVLNGEEDSIEDSINGDDLESVNSYQGAIRNESKVSSVNGSGGSSSKSSTQSSQKSSQPVKSQSSSSNGSKSSARRPSSISSDSDYQDSENNEVDNEFATLNALAEELRSKIEELTNRYDAALRLQESEKKRVDSLKEEFHKHLVDQNAHSNLIRGGGFLGGGVGVGVDYSGDIREIRERMDRMLEIQERVEADLLDAKNEAKARELQAKKDAEERDLKAKNEAEERLKTLSGDQKREFEALRKQAADHQAAEKKAREEKEARELAEKARRDDRSWPIRISQLELRSLGHYDGDSGQDCKIPEISGRIRESDKTMELYESGLSVAIYDFGKRGLTYLGHDVDAAGNTAALRESKMTIAKVIDPKGDGESADVYCVISSSPERGMSTTYISESTFQDIALKSRIEYQNAALATAKLVELKKALEVLEAGRKRAYEAMDLSGVVSDDFSEDGNDDFSEDGGDIKSGNFSQKNALDLDYKIKALRKIIEDADLSLDPKSEKAEDDRVKREKVLEILSEYHSGVRKVFEAVRTFESDSKKLEKQIEEAKNNLKNSSDDGLPDLYGTYQKKLSALGLKEDQIDEILGSDDLIARLTSLESGEREPFDNFGQNLQHSREFVEDLYPTRSHALKRAAQYSLKKEFGDLTKSKYQDSSGIEHPVLEGVEGDALKSAVAKSSDTKKCLESLTVVEKDNARRVASTEFSRNAAREIEEANKEKLDFSEFEKQAATAQLAQHWKSNRFFTSSNALASKETDVKDFFEKAKMSDSPYPGLQVSRPNRRNDIATVVFNGLNRFDPKSEAGYEGDDMMYLHVRGTVAPNALYVRVCLATGDGGNNIKAYKDGKETDKTFKYGDIIMDESTVHTKDSSGNYHAKGVSSLSKVDQGLCNNFKVKAMSVIDGERKTAILFEGVPVTPQNGITKVAQVKEVPVTVLAKMTPLISLVTKKRADKKGKEISDGGIYVQDASDPNKPPVLTGPLWNDKLLLAELAKHGVTENIPTCDSLKTKMNLPRSIFKTNSAKPIGLDPDLTNLPPPPIKGSRGLGG